MIIVDGNDAPAAGAWLAQGRLWKKLNLPQTPGSS
jgi:hypothetical protein